MEGFGRITRAWTKHAGVISGYALLLSISLVVVWSPSSTFPPTVGAAVDPFGQVERLLCQTASIIVYVVLLTISQGRWWSGCVLSAVGLSFAASVAWFCAMMGAVFAESMLAFVWCVLACGVGGFYALYFWRFLHMDADDAAPAILLASSLTVIPSLMMELLEPIICFAVLFFVLGPLAIGALFRSGHYVAELVPDGSPSQGKWRPFFASAARPLLCLLLCSFAVGLVRSQPFTHEVTMLEADQILKLVMGLSPFALLLLSVKIDLGRLADKLYDVLFPVTAVVFLLLPLVGDGFSGILFAVIMVAFFIVSPLLIISCIRMSLRFRVQGMVVFGLFMGSFYLASALGSMLGIQMQTDRGTYNTVALLVVALVTVWILAVAGHVLDKRGREASARQSGPADQGLRDAWLAQMGEQYGLSERECEVADLLSRGRTVSFVAEALFISKSTVQSHSKSLYKKMGIHSKQELMSSFEEFAESVGTKE